MRKAFFLLSLLVIISLTAGCGGDSKKSSSGKSAAQKIKDPSPDRHFFHTKAEAAPFAGPTPLKVKFTVAAFRAAGPVRYYWRFDDGTTSREQNPTHTFKSAGSYTVVMDAKDQRNFNDRWNLVLGVWPVKVWKGRKPLEQLSQNEIKKLQRDQARRTVKRIHDLRAAGLPTGAPLLKPNPQGKKGSQQQ